MRAMAAYKWKKQRGSCEMTCSACGEHTKPTYHGQAFEDESALREHIRERGRPNHIDDEIYIHALWSNEVFRELCSGCKEKANRGNLVTTLTKSASKE